MKPYPVNFKYTGRFELMPGWVPKVLQSWFDEGWVCDIAVKRMKHHLSGRRMVTVEITASSSEDLAAKRKAINAMIEAQGYGPQALRNRSKIKK